MGVRRLLSLVLTVVLAVPALGGAQAIAHPRGLGTERPVNPTPVYSGLAHGAVTMASNSVVTCAVQPCAENAGNDQPVVWVKTDPAAPGNTASSADLAIPAGATVLSARLYWQLNPDSDRSAADSGDATKANQVSVKVPGSVSYQRITADVYDWFPAMATGAKPTAHAGVKDVTSIVKAAGAGTYAVADIQACRGTSGSTAGNLGCWGGWSLVVAYEDPSQPLRYLQLWDGYQVVRGKTSVVINLTGVKAVSSHIPNATLGITAGDGDANIRGDYLEFGRDTSALTRLTLPGPPPPPGAKPDNAFASRIDTVNADGTGSDLTNRNPSPVNNMGYDARTIDVTGKVPAGTDRLAVKIGTDGDAIYAQSIWLMTDAAEPDLQITKANNPVGTTTDTPPGWVTKGSTVDYSFDVANRHANGSVSDLDTATDVVLTDTLPTGLTYVAGSNTRCTAAGQKVTCTLPDMAPGAVSKVAFKVTVGAVADGTKLDNTADLTFKGKDTGRDQSRTSNTVRNTVTSPRYDLTKTVDKAEALPGDTLTYAVTAHNSGPIPAPDIVITDTLPAGVTFVSSQATQGTSSGNAPVTWKLGELSVDGTASLTIKVTVTEAAIGKTLVNRVKGTSGPPSIVPPANQCPDDAAAACVTTTVPGPGYTVTKAVDKKSANPGDKITYTVTAHNNGRVVTDITVTDDLTGVLDDATYNGDAKPSAGMAEYTQPRLRVEFGRVDADKSVTVTYSVTVKNPDTGDHQLSNVVTPGTPGGSCVPGPCATTTPVSGVEITKTPSVDKANPGDTVTYTVVVKNTGQTPLVGGTFTDDLGGVLDDAGYVGANASSGEVSYQAPKLTWTGDVPVGESAKITYSVKVHNPDTGDHRLLNVVTSTTPGNNCVAGCSTSTPVSGLKIVKKAVPSVVKPGDTVSYTVTVENTGQTAQNAALSDDLAAVLDDAVYNRDALATFGTVSYAEPKLSWSGTMRPGDTAKITYSVRVNNPVGGDHRLSNVVTSDTPGGNCPPGSADPDCSTTTLLPGVEIIKSVDKSQADPGDTVTYTVVVRNTGRTLLSGATFTDDLNGVVGDAIYNNDALATDGKVSYQAPKLTWTGDVPVGKDVKVTYSVTVSNPDTGRHLLVNVVTSTTPGNNCVAGCSTSTPVSGLKIVKKAVPSVVNPGDTVSYTVTVTNTGKTVQSANFTDDLSGALDDAVYDNNAVATFGELSYLEPKLSWSGTMQPGDTAKITYSVRVNNPVGGDHRLSNVVTSDTPGGNCPPGSADPDCSTTTLLPGVDIVKSVDKSQADPGDTVTYTVKVRNTGQTVLSGATFTDDLSNVVDDATYDGGATATAGKIEYLAPRLTWTGDVPVGTTVTVTYSVRVNTPAIGDHRLSNVVTSTTPGNNCVTGCSTDTPVSGLRIVKQADKATVVPGEKVTYTVTVVNSGRTRQNSVSFTDDLSQVLDDATYNGDQTASSGSVTYREPTLSWTGVLGIGEQATITYSVTVNDPDTGDKKLGNTIVSDTPGGNCPPGSKDPDCSSQVPAPGLVITKTADKQQAGPGDTVTYTVTVLNDGQLDLTAATFTDDLSPVLDDAVYGADAKATSGKVSYEVPKLTWTGDLRIGASATVTYSVRVGNPITGDHKLRNTVSSETPGNNCAPGSTDPRCASTVPLSGMEISKSVDKSQANPGDTVTYTVVVRNTGQTLLAAATFTDDFSQVLDDAVYGGDARATLGSVGYAAPKLTWTGDLRPGDSATVTYSVKIGNPVAGDHKLTNVVTSTTPGGNCPPGKAAPKCSTTTPVSGLKIVKKASTSEVKPGDTVTYTVTVTNTGQTSLTAATFTDDLSQVLDDATYGGDARATLGSVGYATPKLTWTGDLKPGDSAVVTYSVKVNNPATGDHRLSNVVMSTTPGGNCPPGSTDPDCSTSTVSPGLEIIKSADKAQANPGDTVTYTILVRNTGQTALTGATFTDDLAKVLDDAAYNGDAKATSGTVSYAAPKLTWTGDLPIGSTSTVTYSVKIGAVTIGDHRLSNVVTSTTPGGNCPPGSRDPKCSTTTPVAGLKIVKKASTSEVRPGDTVTYTVTVANTGQTVFKSATFTDDLSQVLDDAVYAADAKATLGTVTYATPKLTWTGDLPVDGSAVVTYSVQVGNPISGDHRLSNVVTSDTPSGNCRPGSTDPSCSTSTSLPGMEITKSADKSQADPGGTVTYTVVVKNTGQTALTGATFTDDLSKVLDDAAYNGDAKATLGTVGYTAPKLTWTGDLKPGDSATVSYSVKIANPVAGDHRLVNVVTSTTPGNNCATGCSTTTLVSGIQIVKRADKQTANPGDSVTYTVVVTNTGQTPHTGATFADDLSKVLDDAAYSGDAKATLGTVGYAAPNLTWTGDLDVSATATITYSVKVNKPATGDHRLVNVVTSTTPGNNCAAGCSTSTPIPGMQIVKKADKTAATAGDTVIYTVTVTNTGQTVLTGATFGDDLSKVLDDAAYNADAKATLGTVVYAAPTLSWTGDVPVGSGATITYSVTVADPIRGDGALVNAVISTTPGGNCPPGGADPGCGTNTPLKPRPPVPPLPPVVEPPVLAYTGADVLAALVGGLVVLLAGFLLVLFGRARRAGR